MYNSPPTTGKWIKDLNVRLETVKPLVRDIGERLLDISLDNNFFFWISHQKHRQQSKNEQVDSSASKIIAQQKNQ
jgi:hypothetical protein